MLYTIDKCSQLLNTNSVEAPATAEDGETTVADMEESKDFMKLLGVLGFWKITIIERKTEEIFMSTLELRKFTKNRDCIEIPEGNLEVLIEKI